jgi:NAD-dependent DNA ligase
VAGNDCKRFLHNADQIEKLDIRVGDIVFVEAGERLFQNYCG